MSTGACTSTTRAQGRIARSWDLSVLCYRQTLDPGWLNRQRERLLTARLRVRVPPPELVTRSRTGSIGADPPARDVRSRRRCRTRSASSASSQRAAFDVGLDPLERTSGRLGEATDEDLDLRRCSRARRSRSAARPENDTSGSAAAGTARAAWRIGGGATATMPSASRSARPVQRACTGTPSRSIDVDDHEAAASVPPPAVDVQRDRVVAGGVERHQLGRHGGGALVVDLAAEQHDTRSREPAPATSRRGRLSSGFTGGLRCSRTSSRWPSAAT